MRDCLRGLPGLARLALVLSLTLAAGCTASARDPIGLGTGGAGPGDTGGGGGGAGGGPGGGLPVPAALLGRWENVIILQMVGDIQTVTTTWEFQSSGACVRTVKSFSALEGFPRTTVRTGDFTVLNFSVAVSFHDGGSATYPFDFVGNSPSRLLLGGVEYDRIP